MATSDSIFRRCSSLMASLNCADAIFTATFTTRGVCAIALPHSNAVAQQSRLTNRDALIGSRRKEEEGDRQLRRRGDGEFAIRHSSALDLALIGDDFLETGLDSCTRTHLEFGYLDGPQDQAFCDSLVICSALRLEQPPDLGLQCLNILLPDGRVKAGVTNYEHAVAPVIRRFPGLAIHRQRQVVLLSTGRVLDHRKA